jgi:hypothetical protein
MILARRGNGKHARARGIRVIPIPLKRYSHAIIGLPLVIWLTPKMEGWAGSPITG